MSTAIDGCSGRDCPVTTPWWEPGVLEGTDDRWWRSQVDSLSVLTGPNAVAPCGRPSDQGYLDAQSTHRYTP
jgi:hypothetical protein